MYFYRLDQTLLRPGRVDVKALVDNATFYQLARMFARFHLTSTEAECEAFAHGVESSGSTFSPAQVQAYLMRFRHDMNEALKNAHNIKHMI